MQIYVSGLPTAVGSVSFHLNTKDTIEILRRKIEIEFPFLELASYRILHHGREPPSDASVGSIGTFLDFNIPVLGGKGGFGSNLRQQGVRMQNKKTSNIESCRDLSGKRLAIVNEAQR